MLVWFLSLKPAQQVKLLVGKIPFMLNSNVSWYFWSFKCHKIYFAVESNKTIKISNCHAFEKPRKLLLYQK